MKSKSFFNPGNPDAQAGWSSAFGEHFSTIFGGGPSFAPPAANLLTGFSKSVPTFSMPELFTGLGDFEVYWGNFNTAACLYGWNRPCSHDYRTQTFALRLKGNAPHFFPTLFKDHLNEFNFLVHAFRQNYTTNVEISKTRLIAARQQLGQDIAAFLCDIRTLARLAYCDHQHLLEQKVVNSFIEGLNNSTLRRDLRKLKPENADHASTKVLKQQAHLELEGQNPIGTTSGSSVGVNHMTTQFLTDNTAFFDESVPSLDRLIETPITRQTVKTEDDAIVLVAESEIETVSWKGEARKTHGRRQEVDTETTHEIHETYICLRAIDKTIAMIRARDLDKDTIPKSVGRNKRNSSVRVQSPCIDRGQNRQNINFNSQNAQNRPQPPYQNRQHDFKYNPGQRNYSNTSRSKTSCARIPKELITLLQKVKIVLVA